jgi:hypothetical protein
MLMSSCSERRNSKTAFATVPALTALLLATAQPVAGSSYALCYYEEPDSFFWHGIQRMTWDNMLLMIALALMAIYALAVTVERSIVYQTSLRENAAFESVALTALYYGRPLEVFEIAIRFKRSPVAAVVASCCSKTLNIADSPDPTAPLIAQETRIKTGLSALGLIGRTAPLLGAILASLVIAEAAWSWRLAEGTSPYWFLGAGPPAGVGLVFGLLVGVFATWASCLLSSQAHRILLETTRLAPSILSRARRQFLAAHPAPATSLIERRATRFQG